MLEIILQIMPLIPWPLELLYRRVCGSDDYGDDIGNFRSSTGLALATVA
jgi:hypothetical protein